MWTRKTAKEAIPPSSPSVTNSPLFAKSPLESLIMMSRLPISSKTPFPNPITPQTVRNALKENNFCSVIKRKSPLFKKGHQLAHLRFAQYHEDWTVEDCKRVLLSDETKINRIGSDGSQ